MVGDVQPEARYLLRSLWRKDRLDGGDSRSHCCKASCCNSAQLRGSQSGGNDLFIGRWCRVCEGIRALSPAAPATRHSHGGVYGLISRPNGQTAKMRAIMYGEWDWQRTRYKNNAETSPNFPEHYVLRFEPDGFLSAQVDCKSAGGRYRFEGCGITLNLNNSTLKSCQPSPSKKCFSKT